MPDQVGPRRRRPTLVTRRDAGTSRERSPAKLSQWMRPRATASARAVSSSLRSSRVPSLISSKKEAPHCAR